MTLNKVKGFEDLSVFQRSYKLSLEMHALSQDFPKHEQYELGSQIRRGSKSICANLAEGFGKQVISKAEFKRFILMAMGSADEMRVWLRYCYDLGYVNRPRWSCLSKQYREIAKMLNVLHREWV